MQKLWFKAKQYGWGWYPASWEGWLVLAVYLIAVIWGAVYLFSGFETGGTKTSAELPMAIVTFVVADIIATAILIWVCCKTGEKATWRWGKK